MTFGFQILKRGRTLRPVPLLALACAVAAANPATANYRYRVLYTFCSQPNCADGQTPTASLLMDQAGNLYGTTQSSASVGGTVFKLTLRRKNRWKQKTLYNFCSQSNCASSSTPLIVDTSGNLYGTTRPSSANDGGFIFELRPRQTGEWRYKLLYTFPCSGTDCPNGRLPSGLTYPGAASGQPYDGTAALFGTTEAGGAAYFDGVAFRLEPLNRRWRQTVLYDFCSVPNCADGYAPHGTPVMDSAGRLWGTTSSGGGDRSGGTVYSITGTNESVEYDFCSVTEECLDGIEPQAPVFLDNFGRIVGTTTYGGKAGSVGFGTLFAVSGGSEHVLHSFNSKAGSADGVYPTAGVIEDSAGNIFGVAPSGGDSNGDGVAFEFQNRRLRVLHTFGSAADGTDGCTPLGGLIMDAAGNLYGTTSGCGAGNGGTVFELSPN